ncbi:RNA polymerase sigma-70 factor, ECF subfamily [Chitinophaga sp. CF118]|uniref:RNA polymerase sigma factor n=1 Tax=Chitinophaga sp. CF118 TaxID=1884367 RepID=UPI0008DF4A11|nr:sigma-70 family RNA polymerase sigma factor [Chitinophaga sp. CF118]SFE06331.1 RNA polymerase sigma-70 factor, ECF subfamily [Chitinophaga sp. CF118]
MKRYCELTDEELIKLYRSGNDSAFSVLVSRHKTRIFTTIMLLVKDRYLAEDIFQDVFIKIINALNEGHYLDNSRFIAWAVRIAHNCCISHFRKKNAWPAFSVVYKDDLANSGYHQEESQEQRIIIKETHAAVQAVLDQLPEAQREALILRYYADLSFKEIAQTVNVGINTALGRVRYAIMNMRKIMEREEALEAV